VIKSKLILLPLVVFVVLTLLACSDSDDDENPTAPAATVVTEEPSSYSFTIEQSDGQTLALDAVPQRIISLSPYATEVFCELGAGDQLVAVDLYANCPAEGGTLPQLDSFEPNLEAIAGYEPDLVYVDGEAVLQPLRDLDIPVLYLTIPSSLEQSLDRIVEFGQLIDSEDTAANLAAAIQGRFDAVSEAIANVETGPRIFHELDDTYYTVSPDSFIGDFYNLLKAENIAAGGEGEYLQLSAEVIIDRDPEVIILADEPFGVTVESVAARPGWDTLSAVQNDRVCPVNPDLVSRPGPYVADALEALAACIYPDRFA
jgi:iron complex transport system substrate-binding protein